MSSTGRSVVDVPLKDAADIVIADRYAIDLTKPLPMFSNVGAEAFACRDKIDGRRPYMVLLQRPAVPMRTMVLTKLMGRQNSGVLCPRAQAIVPHGSEERLATIVETAVGGRVVESLPGLSGAFPAIPERMVRDSILPQLVNILTTLDSLAITHRNISVHSLFYRDEERREIVLGECFSTPPGCLLGAGYEPIERALADPAGRGLGDSTCDMFALGVTLMSLLLGRDLGAVEAEQVTSHVIQRIRHGSYAALGGSHEVTGGIGDLLRGLLDDCPSRRWTLNDVKRWLDGYASRKSVPDQGWIFIRPTVFRDHSVRDRRQLAVEMVEQPKGALDFVRQDRFRHWLENAMPEGQSSDWYDKVLDKRYFGDESGLSPKDEMLAMARLFAVFFPEGPIMYGALRFCPDGLDGYLAMLMAENDGQRLDLLRDLLARNRLAGIVDIISGRSTAVGTITLSKIATLIQYGSAKYLGQGLERCLYELNRMLPCLSPKLRGRHVDTPRKLLQVLEETADRGEPGGTHMDPHLAGFLVAQASGFEPAMIRLSTTADQPDHYALEVVRILGSLQQKFYPQPLRKLGHSILPSLRKSVDKLKSRTRRTQVMSALTALAEEGNLMRIANEINLRALAQRDAKEFQAALQHMQQLGRMLTELENPILITDGRVQNLGGRFACYFAVASLLAVAAIVFTR